MTQLNINFDDVADEIKPIEAGTYQAVIKDVPEIKPNKSGDGSSIWVLHEIIEEGPECGNSIMGFISLKQQTRIKRLALSAGVAVGAGGLDLAELAGATVTIKVAQKPRTDQSGETTMQSNIADWIIPPKVEGEAAPAADGLK